ncbi:MAG: hypothetical protein ACLQM8_22350 [Limisphaerales bacterium]
MNFLQALIPFAVFWGGIVCLIWLSAEVLRWYALSHPRFCVRCGEEVWPERGQIHDQCPNCGACGPGAFECGPGARKRAGQARPRYLQWRQAERELGHPITDPEFEWWLDRRAKDAERESSGGQGR